MPTATLPISIAPSSAQEIISETRGYYLTGHPLPTRESLAIEIQWAARAGFNLLLFPVYVNGYTNFVCETARAADFAPINPQLKKWDPLAEALEMAQDLNLSVWGFLRPYNFHPRYAAVPNKLLKRFPDWRLAVHPDFAQSPGARREQYIACPINREYRRYLADLLTELVTGYPIDGLAINYTGYGLRGGSLEDYPFCFCRACREQFAVDHKGNLVRKASTSAKGLELVRQWQTESSSASLRYLRHRLMKSRRTLRLACRAQPQWRWNLDDTGPLIYQPYCLDWNRLLGEGTVEELIVDHDDETDMRIFSNRLVSDLSELHSEALILPSIRINKPGDLEFPIQAVRRYPVSGFLIEPGENLRPGDAQLIRRRYLSANATLPEISPLAAVGHLLSRVRTRHEDNELIHDFMRDFLRLIEQALQRETNYKDLEIILENLTGLQRAIRRGRLGQMDIPESTMRDLALARRLLRLACLDVRS